MAAPTPSFHISWSIISIPVKSSPAARDAKTELVNLHAACSAKLNLLKKCSACELTVGNDDIVKGYEQAKGQFVILAQAEVDAAASEQSKVMTVKAFVPVEGIEIVYLGPSNYLAPVEPASLKAFELFRRAMLETQSDAIVQYTAYGRDKIGLIRPLDVGLMLHDLFYDTEVRTYESKVPARDPGITPQEMHLARQLVEVSLVEPAPGSTAFRQAIDGLSDGYMDRLQRIIEAKLAGDALPVAAAEAPKSNVVDLMAALQASLARKAPAKIEAPAPAAVAADVQPKTAARARKTA